jgi:hypothetical protein
MSQATRDVVNGTFMEKYGSELISSQRWNKWLES